MSNDKSPNIAVFVSEDSETTAKIAKMYGTEPGVTYMAIAPAKSRNAVVAAIDKVVDESWENS